MKPPTNTAIAPEIAPAGWRTPAGPTRRRALAAGLGGALLAGGAAAARAAAPTNPGPGVVVVSPGLDLPPALQAPGQPARRTLRIHLPRGLRSGAAAATGRRYPVIYLHDAQNLFDAATAYAGEWGLDEALDQLAATTGLEAIAVGIDHGGERRIAELTPWSHPRIGAPLGEAYLGFVVDVVKPFVDARWPTLPGPAHTLMAGSSMGGLMSHYALHQRPEVFGAAAVLSPAFWIAPAVFEHTETRPRPASARLYLYAGGQEGDSMAADAQRMHALLASQGPAGPASLRWRLAPAAGHNEAAWRAVLPDLLRWWLVPLALA